MNDTQKLVVNISAYDPDQQNCGCKDENYFSIQSQNNPGWALSNRINYLMQVAEREGYVYADINQAWAFMEADFYTESEKFDNFWDLTEVECEE